MEIPMKFWMISILLVCFISIQGLAQTVPFPEERHEETDLFPEPTDGYIAKINPPGFAWLAVDSAETYVVTIRDANTKKMIVQSQRIRDYVFIPGRILEPGTYTWTIRAFDRSGTLLAIRRPYKLTIPAGLNQQPLPDIPDLLSGIHDEHPRLIFTKKRLPEIRASLTTTRTEAWKILKATADASLDLTVPEGPTYGHYDIETEFIPRRMEYQKYYRDLRVSIDRGLMALSLAWLMTGDEKYATGAKRILLEIAGWDPFGITSSNINYFDEVGLSLARCTHRAYDWLYDAMTDEERALVREHCIARARDTYQRVGIDRPFHKRPGSSHDGRLIGYLGEQAIVLNGEAPDEEVEDWLEYSLVAFMTVYPHWGGDDGGWAEGMDYGPRYNMFIAPWVESLLAVSDINLWQRPFFRNVRNFFMSCMRPNAERRPFGDGAEIGLRMPHRHTNGVAAYLKLHAYRFDDPVCQWWAEQLPLPETYTYYPVIPMIPEFSGRAPRPSVTGKADIFNDIGWAAMHSDFSSLENDVFFLFRSSPYATVSHSHGDNNAFHISVGGKPLAIASGYYGPVYGMPHHADWTRATKANNAILINGQGQVIRDFTARGRIAEFSHKDIITYVAGDAAQAYQGLFERCDRHALFVRPGLFVLLDDLEGTEASTYQWLLHSLEPIEMEEDAQHLISRRENAWLDVHLFNSSGEHFVFTQKDTFDTPYMEGVPDTYANVLTDYWHEAYGRDIDPQYHFQASTLKPEKSIRIAAILVAGSREERPEIKLFKGYGWRGAEVIYPQGIATVWAKLDPMAKLPEPLMDLYESVDEECCVIGLWTPLYTDTPAEVIAGKRIARD
jgi:hypothetical protein